VISALLLALAVPAAQPAGPPAPEPVEKLRRVVVAAIRNCPKPVGDEVVVCSKDRGVAEAYRLPKIAERYEYETKGETASAAAKRRMGGGEAGIGSCSAVGAGGASGCTLKSIRDQQ
jgi:hypothetical protein